MGKTDHERGLKTAGDLRAHVEISSSWQYRLSAAELTLFELVSPLGNVVRKVRTTTLEAAKLHLNPDRTQTVREIK